MCEEDSRWSNLEEGSPEFRLALCSKCSFLTESTAVRCEACGAKMHSDRNMADKSSSAPAGSYEEAHALRQIVHHVASRKPQSPPLETTSSSLTRWRRKVKRACRSALVETVFLGLDMHGAGVLGSKSMYRFACMCGFNGGMAKWEDEYSALCEQFRLDPAVGIDLEDFTWLMDQPDFKGHCTDMELRGLLLECNALLLRRSGREEIDWPPPMAQQPGARTTPTLSIATTTCSESSRGDMTRAGVRQRSGSCNTGSRSCEASSGRRSISSLLRRGSDRGFRSSQHHQERPQQREEVSEDESKASDDDTSGEEDSSESEGDEVDEQGSGQELGDSEAESKESMSDSDINSEEEARHKPEDALDLVPPEGTIIDVLYDDGLWRRARIVRGSDILAQVVYLESGDFDDIDFDKHIAVLARPRIMFRSQDSCVSYTNSESGAADRGVKNTSTARSSVYSSSSSASSSSWSEEMPARSLTAPVSEAMNVAEVDDLPVEKRRFGSKLESQREAKLMNSSLDYSHRELDEHADEEPEQDCHRSIDADGDSGHGSTIGDMEDVKRRAHGHEYLTLSSTISSHSTYPGSEFSNCSSDESSSEWDEKASGSGVPGASRGRASPKREMLRTAQRRQEQEMQQPQKPSHLAFSLLPMNTFA